MNPRKITLKYLGWCPGVSSASNFIPDKEIPNSLVFFASLLFLLLVGTFQLTLPRPTWDPKIVTINGVEYYDNNFTYSFDYSQLIGKDIEFFQPVNSSEFIRGDSVESELSFTNLEELEDTLRGLNSPEIVIGYTMWLTNGTWEETLARYAPVSSSDRQITSVGESFGTSSSTFIQYSVLRQDPNYSMSGIMIKKMYKSEPGTSSPVWVIHVQIDKSPPYTGTLFQAGTR